MNHLNWRTMLFVSLTLFSLFFGAGNLIFPPYLGQEAGTYASRAFFGFWLSAVVFPVVAVIVVAKSGGLRPLIQRIHPKFATLFSLLIYLSIGPLLGIPRAGSLPFEMAVQPFLQGDPSQTKLLLFLFTTCFFFFAGFLALTPQKLVDRMGKIMTPILLFLIVVVFIGTLRVTTGNIKLHTVAYTHPISQGFLDGYLTMDTIAALNFGYVIAKVMRQQGIQESAVISVTRKAGIIAGVVLTLVYAMLLFMGMKSGSLYGTSEHGAETLIRIIYHKFQTPGLILLATIFTLACLTTSVGLITSCSQYFQTFTSLSYNRWVVIFTLWSFVFANMGLSMLLKISVPLLEMIYPVAIVVIILAVFNQIETHSFTARCVIAVTLMMSILNLLMGHNGFEMLTKVMHTIPFSKVGFVWAIPALVVAIGCRVYERLKY